MEKICTKCKASKSFDEFYSDQSTKDSKSCHCKECLRSYAAKYRHENKQKSREYNRKYHDTPIGKLKRRGKNLRALYWPHLTSSQALEAYNALFDKQEGKCAFCKESGLTLAVDHDHKSGKVRGLLCSTCNTSMVGSHTLETAKTMVSYLSEQNG